jgi:hypothetical protein
MSAKSFQNRVSSAGWIVILASLAHLVWGHGNVVSASGGSDVVDGAQTISTTELWRCGGEQDDMVLGMIGEVVVDLQGNAYLLDNQQSLLHVIGPDGTYRGSVGREGEGPGEFRMPSGVGLLSDSVLCVTQVMPPRAVLMSITGRALGDHPLARELAGSYLNGSAVVNGQLSVKLGQVTQNEESVEFKTSFGLLDPNGQMSPPYWEQSQTADFANMTFDEKADAEPVWVFGTEGRLFVNDDWDQYKVQVLGAGPTVEHVIVRPYVHLRRDERELEAIETQKRSGKIAAETVVSTTVRDIVRLFARPGGGLWVLTGRGNQAIPGDVVAVFDEFDRAGAFVRSVTVAGARRPHVDEFYLVNDLLFVVRNGAEGSASDAESGPDGEIEIVCLRMDSPR